MKIWIISGGHYYEGSEILHISSTEEKANKWKKDNYKFRSPYPDDKHWEKKSNHKWCRVINSHGGNCHYDYIEITESEIDGE